MDKQSRINGNTVLAPEYVPSRRHKNEEDEKLKRERKQKLINERNIKVKKKTRTLKNIGIVFVLGVTLIGRYCAIYNMQKNLSEVKTQISTLNKENENLRVELVKFNNMVYIEDIAVNKLHMVRPEKSLAIHLNLSKDNFEDTLSENDIKHESLLQKIKNILF